MVKYSREDAAECARLHLAGLSSVNEAVLDSVDHEYLRGECRSLILTAVSSAAAVAVGVFIDIRVSGPVLALAAAEILFAICHLRRTEEDLRWSRFFTHHYHELVTARDQVSEITGSRSEATRIVLDEAMIRI